MLERSQTNKVTNWLPKVFSLNQSKRLNQLWIDSHIYSAHPGYTLSEFTTIRIPKGGRNIPIHNQPYMHVHYLLNCMHVLSVPSSLTPTYTTIKIFPFGSRENRVNGGFVLEERVRRF